MATKKSTTTKKRKTTVEEISSDRQLTAILFCAMGVIFIALTIVTGESFWRTLHYFNFGLFGWCAYLIGPIFIYLAIVNTLERPTFSTTAQGWESGFLILLLSGITTIFSEKMVLSDGFFAKFGDLYRNGKELVGGGVLSMILGVSFLEMMGRTAAIIVSLVLILADIMLLTGTTLVGLAKDTKKAGQKIKTVYEEQVEQRVTEQRMKISEENRRPNPNTIIDIPLDDEPPRRKRSSSTLPVEQNPVATRPLTAAERLSAAKAAGISQPEMKDRGPEITTVTQEIKHDFASEEPINGFKAVENKQAQEIKAADKRVIDIPLDVEKTKSAGQQMEEAAKDPQLEALINNAMNKGTEAEKRAKAEAQALAELEKQKITEIMDDLETIPYTFPSVDLLKEMKKPDESNVTEELRHNADLLIDALKSFNVEAKVIDISRGPAVTRYELQPGTGVKISKIAGLSDDIALNLAATGVRIEAPIPGKAAVGIEVPNKNVSMVGIKEIIDSDEFRNSKSKLTVALGRDIAGKVVTADLAKMPHLLIAGSTGSGKSVCINSMLISLLYKSSPDEVKLLLVDPKVVELGVYNGVPHLLIPVVTDPRKAAGALNWAVAEMLKRYKAFADNGVRDISGFNALADENSELQRMPRVVIVIDELADLMMAASNDVEDAICRLAQMARAAGMHLVVATQRPSVDVITGLIKANINSRIAFAVSSQVDSRTILDHGGAEKLLGRGDMLFNPIGAPKPSRVQGCFVSDKEVEDVVKFIKDGGTAKYDDDILDNIERLASQDKGKKGAESADDGGGFSEEDDMLPAAIECVIDMGQASTSLLQRKLKLGYARAARIIDQMEERGIVGPFEGSKPRQVLMSKEQWLEKKLQSDEENT